MNTSLYVTLVQAARAQKDHQDRVEGGAGVVAHRRSGRQGWKVLRKLLKPLMKQSPRMNRGQPLPPGVGQPLAPARSRGPPTCQVIHASPGDSRRIDETRYYPLNSPIMTIGELALAEGIVGMTAASPSATC